MARVLAVVSELMLASRVRESLEAAGHEVAIAPTLPDTVQAEVLVCDLDAVDAAAVASAGIPSIGFYSHVETARRAHALAAGIDIVVPRSRMSRQLPQLIERLLESG